jgi:threonyl-tRNA synthetase
MKWIITICLVGQLIGQAVNINVYRVEGEPEETLFETQIFEAVVKMYEDKTGEKFNIKIIPLKFYSDLFNTFDKIPSSEKDITIAVSAVFRTNDRALKYDFNSVHLPTKQSIFGHKNKVYADTLNVWKIKGTKIIFVEKSLQENAFNDIKKTANVTGIKAKDFEEKIKLFQAGRADFMIGSNIQHQSLVELQYLIDIPSSETTGLAFMYPKGSKLKLSLDKYIDYFIRSAKYYQLINDIFGKEVGQLLVKKYIVN